MADTSIGKAYVQIVPQAKGISKDIESAIGGDVSKSGDSAGKSFASQMVGAIKGVAIAAGVGKIFSDAINAGGDLQQSFGGLETIYGDAADAAKDYAYQAAQAGISANDYAEQAVSFGASLKQAFEGDTTKAVEAANTAIMDMTDNAAKMGTPIENIQNAYQGFAKQNYTMLDNLKLGYGGTKEEMERLLADAEKLSGQEYDISNLGDVYDAIHVIQEDLGLTGVAAQEASETFSGSFGAMQAAAQNLLADIALGADIGPDIAALGQSVENFFVGNLLPMVSNIVQQIPTFVAQIPGFLADIIPQAIPIMADMVAGLAQGLIDNGPVFIDGMNDLMQSAWQAICDIDWEGAASIAVDLLKAGWQRLQDAAQEVWDLVVGIFTGEIEFPDLSGAAKIVWDGLCDIAQEVWDRVVEIFTGVIDFLGLSDVAEAAWNGICDIAQGIWDTITGIFGADIEFPSLDQLASAAWETLTSVAQGIWDLITGIFTGDIEFPSLDELASAAWDTLTGIAQGIWDAITGIFTADISFPSLDSFASAAWGTLTGIASGIWEGIKGVFGALDISFADLSETASAAWNGLKGVATGVWNGIKEVFGSFDIEWPDFGELASGALEGLKNAAQGVWDWIMGLFSGSSEESVETIQGSTDEMAKTLAEAKLEISEVDMSQVILANEKLKNNVLFWQNMFANMKLTIPTPKTNNLQSVSQVISSWIKTWKGQMDFSWNLPSLHGHLPVISVSMHTASSSDGKTTVSYPELNVSGFKWFAKGGIFDSPSIIGVGESGAEAVVPLNRLWKQMDKTLSRNAGNRATIYQTFNVTADDPALFANEVARELQQQLRMG